MVIIWLMMVNNDLVGDDLTILKNMKVNGKDDIPYMKWKIKHVWNHQPVIFQLSISKFRYTYNLFHHGKYVV